VGINIFNETGSVCLAENKLQIILRASVFLEKVPQLLDDFRAQATERF